MPDLDQIAADLQTAANPYRLKILERLLDRAHSPDELADTLLIDPGDVQKHLTRLRKDGWIEEDDHHAYRIRDTGKIARLQRFAPEIFPAPPPLPDD